MKVTIHQPSYWPWLGLLDKIAKAEKFIILDDVAANKASFQYRNQFFCNGSNKNLTLPVNHRLGKKLNELRLKNDNWKKDHLNKLKNYYLKAPYFNSIFPDIENLYHSFEGDKALEFIFDTMKFSFSFLNITVDTIFSSEMKSNEVKGDLVIDLCNKVNARTYLSGKGAEQYLDDDHLRKFMENGVDLEWHYFEHPIYSQHNKFDFISGLACLDLFFWNGRKNSCEIFWKNIK
jgi:hypothetical protein